MDMGMEPCCNNAWLSLFWADPTIFFPLISSSLGVGNEKQGLLLLDK